MKWLKTACICVVFVLSGCSEIIEPSDLAYVVAIGIDSANRKNA